MKIENSKLLVTGATGQLAYSIVSKLASDNTVHAIARFGAPGSVDKLEAVGATCIKLDYTSDDLNQLDDDYDYVLHFATYQVPGGEDFDEAIRVNAVGTGKLMYHFRHVKGFFFSSTCSVYQPRGAKPLKESDALGDALQFFDLHNIAAGRAEIPLPRSLRFGNETHNPDSGSSAIFTRDDS